MSQPAASETLPGVGVPLDGASTGEVFRLHPQVRRDILAGSGAAAIVCMGVALVSLQALSGLHNPTALLLVLAAEVAGLAAASGCALWALGLAVRVDAEGIRRYNVLFPGRPGRSWAWKELEGVGLRQWFLAWRPGYPLERVHLGLRGGREEILPPLDRHRVFLDLARRNIERCRLAARR
jgi:hypothetical protein